MVEAFEYFDFAVEVLLQLLVKLRQIDRFDRDKGSGGLQMSKSALFIKYNPYTGESSSELEMLAIAWWSNYCITHQFSIGHLHYAFPCRR